MGTSLDRVDLKRVAKNFRNDFNDVIEIFDVNHPAVKDTFRWLDTQISILEDTAHGDEHPEDDIFWIIQTIDQVLKILMKL